MREILKEKGYKATPARLAILDIFTKNKIPESAESVFQELKKNKKTQNINEATVYRTFASFEKSNILKRIDFRKDANFFELVDQCHHHHITCLSCDTIEDFENKEIEKILGRIARNSSKFIKIKDHSLELFGFCKVCHK